MAKIPYIKYDELNEFYTIKELCKLFKMEKAELKEKCEKYKIQPRQDEIGQVGFVKYDVRKIHYAIYHETDSKNVWVDDDLWND